MNIPLTPDDARALSQAMLAEQRAQQDAETARLYRTWRDAQDAKSELLTKLASTYNFDATAPLRFDPQSGTLSTENGSGT